MAEAVHSSRTRLIMAVVGVFVLAVLAVQATLLKQLYDRAEELNAAQTSKAILTNAIHSLNTELAVDPQTGRHYVPGSRVVLPAKLESHVYYRGGTDGMSLWLIDANNQMQAIDKMWAAEDISRAYQQVNLAQMCSRQVTVSFNLANPKDSDDKLTLKNTKKLKDGRTAYIYQNECPYGAEPLLRSVDQMESF